MLKLLKSIKNALVPVYQTKQEQRQAQNREQVKKILQGLEQRGY